MTYNLLWSARGAAARMLAGLDLLNRTGTSRGIAIIAAGVLVVGGGAAVTHRGGGNNVRNDDAYAVATNQDIAKLEDYARGIGPQATGRKTGGDLLPDVDTMIARLAARLATTPDDVSGWRMLGWAHFQFGRYEQAMAALEKALALDPNSVELQAALAAVKAKSADASRHRATPGQDEEHVENAIAAGAAAPELPADARSDGQQIRNADGIGRHD